MYSTSEKILRNTVNTRQENLIQPSISELPLQEALPQKVVEDKISPSRETAPVAFPEKKPDMSTIKLTHSAEFDTFTNGVLNPKPERGMNQFLRIHRANGIRFILKKTFFISVI